MTDAELLRFGQDNRYMCSPYANLGKPPLEAFVIQLREARAEWSPSLSCPRDSHARALIEQAFRTLHADCRDRNQFQADQELRESLRLQESNVKDMVVGIESQQGYAAKTVQAFCTKGGTLLRSCAIS